MNLRILIDFSMIINEIWMDNGLSELFLIYYIFFMLNYLLFYVIILSFYYYFM